MSIEIGGISAHNVQKKQKPDDASVVAGGVLAFHPQQYTTLANGHPNCVFDVKNTQLS